jgi:hypothetical protein
MLTSLARFTVALVLASSVLGAAIPARANDDTTAAATSSALNTEGTASGALWKNNVHDKISEPPVTTAIAEGDFSNMSSRDLLLTFSAGGLAPSRRSGNLWKGREHQEVGRDGLAPSRRSGELWKGIEHQEVARDGGAASRRSGELWKGIEHQEVARDGGAPSRRSGELWRGIEHEEVARDGGAPSRRSGELWRGLEHEEVSASPEA